MERQRPSPPEEILREILTYVLLVSPRDFFRYRPDASDRRTQREILHRSSQLLLVSKCWLRVGTPLLYESLELSRPAHTSAVAKLLREHPEVGSAVRRLKLEGGIAEDLVHIARHAPNLRSLFISLRIRHCQTITGLEHALALFNPTKLYVELEVVSKGPSSQNAVEARLLLFSHVSDVWKSLRTVTFGPLFSLSMTTETKTALLSSSMEEFRCEARDLRVWIRRGMMKSMLESGRVTRITCFGASAETDIRDLLRKEGLAEHAHKFTFDPASLK